MSEQLKPELRFPEFDGDWVAIKTGEEEITKKIGDGIHSTPQYDDEGDYYFINGNNLVEGEIQFFETTKKVNSEEFDKYRLDLDTNTLLLSINGTIGNLAYYNGEKVVLGKSAAYLKFNNSTLANLYYQIFNTYEAKSVFHSFLTGSTIQNLSLFGIRNSKFTIPKLPEEQQKIANFLKAIDKRIKLIKAKKDALEDYKTSIMQKLFSQEIRFKQEDGSDFPEWEQYKLGDIGNTLNGLTGKTKDDFGEGQPYIQYMQIFKNSKIDASDFGYVNITPDDNQTKIKYGDILFTTSSETREEVGTSSVLLEQVENLYLNSFSFGFRLDSFEILMPEFARYLFRSYDVRKMVVRLGQGSTRYNMSKVAFMKDSVTLPVKEEQEKIASILSNADEKIIRISEKIDVLIDFKQSLLQKLFV